MSRAVASSASPRAALRPRKDLEQRNSVVPVCQAGRSRGAPEAGGRPPATPRGGGQWAATPRDAGGPTSPRCGLGGQPWGGSSSGAATPRIVAGSASPRDGGAPGASICVAARVRPRLQHEAQEPVGVEMGADGQSLVLNDGRGGLKQFAADEVFDSRVEAQGSQAALFDRFGRNLVHQSLGGYNVCMLAYGHTGSGKTYTIMGDGAAYDPEDTQGSGAGLLPRFLHEVFEVHSSEQQMKATPRYSCEFYEVYNEQIRDLLTAAKTERTRKVHVHPKHGVRIEGLTMSVVSSLEETMGLLNFGNQMRAVAATTLNARSSRSHAIFTFKFENGDEPGCHRESTVTFVDLAGREDPHASRNRAVHFREMTFINTSLFHLAHLISKLSEGQVEQGSLSDFRNSKLTLLLSQALIGNSRTALVATIAPLQSFFEDSASTLAFAQSVKRIRTRPAVNNKAPLAVIRELEAEVRHLQEELGESRTSAAEREHELQAAQALIARYQLSWEEAVLQSEQVGRQRLQVSRRLGLLDAASPKSPEGDLKPFFTKLVDDPSLQGCCNFFLDRQALRIGSDEGSCGIVLQGVGIRAHMCEVSCSAGSGVEVKLLPDESVEGGSSPRVLMNGRCLKASQGPCRMEHGDCVVVGYAHGFRLVVPTKERMLGVGSADPRTLARALLPALDMASAALEVSDETNGRFREVYLQLAPYLKEFGARAPEGAVQSLLGALRRLCPLIDEANLITAEVFGEGCVSFRLQALTDVLRFERDIPALVVCVVQGSGTAAATATTAAAAAAAMPPLDRLPVHERRPARGFAPLGGGGSIAGSSPVGGSLGPPPDGESTQHPQRPLASEMGLGDHMELSGGGEPLLYVWSLEKFLVRLSEIREIYQEGCEARDGFVGVRQRLAARPLLNPWQETGFADLKLLLEGIRHAPQSPIMAWFTRGLLSQPGIASRVVPKLMLGSADLGGEVADAEAALSSVLPVARLLSPAAVESQVSGVASTLSSAPHASLPLSPPDCLEVPDKESDSAHAPHHCEVDGATGVSAEEPSAEPSPPLPSWLVTCPPHDSAPPSEPANQSLVHPPVSPTVPTSFAAQSCCSDRATPSVVTLHDDRPTLEPGHSEIDELRAEVLARRQEVDRVAAERDRLASILDGLVGRLAHEEAMVKSVCSRTIAWPAPALTPPAPGSLAAPLPAAGTPRAPPAAVLALTRSAASPSCSASVAAPTAALGRGGPWPLGSPRRRGIAAAQTPPAGREAPGPVVAALAAATTAAVPHRAAVPRAGHSSHPAAPSDGVAALAGGPATVAGLAGVSPRLVPTPPLPWRPVALRPPPSTFSWGAATCLSPRACSPQRTIGEACSKCRWYPVLA